MLATDYNKATVPACASIGSLSRAQLYAKYHEVSQALALAEAEKEAMSATLQTLLSEVDDKIPRIMEQRHQLQSLCEVPILIATVTHLTPSLLPLIPAG